MKEKVIAFVAVATLNLVMEVELVWTSGRLIPPQILTKGKKQMPILGQRRIMLRDSDKLWCLRAFSFVGHQFDQGDVFKPEGGCPDHLRDRLYRHHYIGTQPPKNKGKTVKKTEKNAKEVKQTQVVTEETPTAAPATRTK